MTEKEIIAPISPHLEEHSNKLAEERAVRTPTRRTRNVTVLDREYVLSGSWRCEKSDTGAHKWTVVEDATTPFGRKWVCTECGLPREYEIPTLSRFDIIKNNMEKVKK